MRTKYKKRFQFKPLQLTIPAPLQPVMGAVSAVLLFLALCLSAVGTAKPVAAVCTVLAVLAALLGIGKLRDLITPPLVALALVVLMDGVSTIYAVSGKYALYEFLKVLTAFALAVIMLVLSAGEGSQPARRIAAVLARSTALTGLVSIDLISTHWISGPVLAFFGLFTDDYAAVGGVEAGIRMTSIFGNPNVFAGCAGIGVLLSLGLVLAAEKKSERMGHLVCLYVNALAFVLAFSMGASAMIALAFLAYLLLELPARRGRLFVLMVETLLVTMVGVALTAATALQSEWTGVQPVPLLCVVIGAAALCLLDRLAGERLGEKLSGHNKALLAIIGGAAAFAVAFVLAAYNLTGGITLQPGESLRRSAYPEPGDYAISAGADSSVQVTVETQNRQDTMMHTSSVLYQGALSEAAFTVPEDSLVTYYTFYSESGARLDEVRFEGNAGSVSVPLGYQLLPAFIANRLQGLFANQNAIQRLVFFEDGLKLFLKSPVIGLGMGGFEEGVRSVQPFFYETKYAHNQYIQAMTETGLIGLLLFLALLVVSAAAVLLHRRKAECVHPLTPALGAALVFMAGHAAVEVVFSSHCYLILAFGVFALISLCCGKSLPVPSVDKAVKTTGILVCAALSTVFLVLLGQNMAAERMLMRDPSFETLEKCAKMDKFEWADYELSYVANVANAEGDPYVLEKAAEYAEKLSHVDSKTIPLYLAIYYFNDGHWQKGVDMVRKYVEYMSGDPDIWQSAFYLLEGYEQDTDEYRAVVLEFVDRMNRWSETHTGTIHLEERSLAFIDRIQNGK